MSVYFNLFICFIFLCFSAGVNLYNDVLLMFEYGWVTLLVLLFESVSDSNSRFGLSLRVKISTHPYKLVGLFLSMYVYMGLSPLCVAGEWYFV